MSLRVRQYCGRPHACSYIYHLGIHLDSSASAFLRNLRKRFEKNIYGHICVEVFTSKYAGHCIYVLLQLEYILMVLIGAIRCLGGTVGMRKAVPR